MLPGGGMMAITSLFGGADLVMLTVAPSHDGFLRGEAAGRR